MVVAPRSTHVVVCTVVLIQGPAHVDYMYCVAYWTLCCPNSYL